MFLESASAWLSSLAVAFGGAPAGDEPYWAAADRLQQRLEATWSDRVGYYRLGSGGVETTGNANLLLLHSVAALHGHQGPARRDDRARRLVRALLRTPPFVTAVPGGDSEPEQRHAPGWVQSMRSTRATQHMAIDAEVVDGLVHAWLARRELQLPGALQALIRRRVSAVTRSGFWRFPGGTLNQINWPARMYTADALVSGSGHLARDDLRAQIARFVAGVRGSPGRAGHLGPGLRFHYTRFRSIHDPLNLDSAEYGSIVASFARFYALARAQGMPTASSGQRWLLRTWLRRVLAGYWTHAGYLNWDTGLGFRRWHQAQKFGLAQQALIGIASADDLATPARRAWAKWIFDRGLEFYERQARKGRWNVAPGVLFGVRVLPLGRGNARLGAARVAANAARAIMAGLGEAPARRPPPLYAFDPDTARLAVTTPSYNTAIVPVNQGAFPYGGIELARLYDARQEIAANIGGRPPASFGLLVRNPAGKRLLATQTPRARVAGTLRLTQAPAGVGVPPHTSRRTAYAGPFTDLRATGTARSGPLRARTSHRFTRNFIETRWSLRGHRRRHRVDVLFPSHGQGARIEAVRPDGSRTQVRSAPLPLADVAYFDIRSARSGYVVIPRSPRAAVTARVIHTARQPSAPDPGPTLAVQLRTRPRLAFAARISPVPAGRDAETIAERLGWR